MTKTANTLPKPYDVRPVSAEGDQKPEPLYTAVGRALSTWGTFETHLGLLFGQFMQTRSSLERVARVFGTIQTFEGRLSMLKTAAELFFELKPMSFKADFRKLGSVRIL